MKKRYPLSLILLVFVFSASSGLMASNIITIDTLTTKSAKAMPRAARHKIGFNAGGLKSNYPLRYYYDMTFFQAQWNYTYARLGHFEFESMAVLQYGATYYNATLYPFEGYKRGMELGFMAGLNFRFNFWKERLFVSFMGIIGPMYTPHMPSRQGTPLNFSDNLAVSIGGRVAGHYMIDLRLGYRHLSNAGINPPNYGINSHWISGGIYY
ncbi:MAG: acyloxyacyl hydrolase, partial [Mucinivorans sp.]